MATHYLFCGIKENIMYCIDYTGPEVSKVLDQVDQIKIHEDRLLDDTLEQFFEKYQDKHIYISINTNLEKEKIEILRKLKKYDNWTLQFSIYAVNEEEKFTALKEVCNRFMFINGADSWESLDLMISYGASEVYISGYLGFCLEKVKRVCVKNGVKIRTYTNLAQIEFSTFPGHDGLKKFFIRPEDIWVYSKYIDVFEFAGNAKQQVVLLKIYQRGYWFGNLNELIIDLNEDVDSRKLPQEFGELRYNCGKRCISGGFCTACRTVREFEKIMDKTGSFVKPHVSD